MTSRREFLSTLGMGLTASPWLGTAMLGTASQADSAHADDGAANTGVAPKRASDDARSEPRRRLAVVTTRWNYKSHAWHMAERFLTGFPWKGRWRKSPCELVAAYVDQQTEGDLSRQRSKEFGFPIFPTVAETLRCGTDRLAVDGVLLIGEHGNYPVNEFGQKQYPRYELFQKIVEVFRKDGKAVPVFNDKHLSWKFDWAKEMVETARAMKFPLMAGSSLPITWRLPSVELPLGVELEEIVCVAHGPPDIYDFHGLESIQCFAERRKGGETGVAWVQAQRGEPVWKALEANDWSKGGWSGELFEACLSRAQTLQQAETNSHRYPTLDQMKHWVKEPFAYRYEHVDGLRCTLLLLNGLTNDFLVAAKVKGAADPVSTQLYLPPVPNVAYSAGLMAKAEEMMLTGKAPYPAERTLLTSGLTEAALQSMAKGGERRETPHLAAVRYESSKMSHFLRE